MRKFLCGAALSVCALIALPAAAADLHVAQSSASVVRISIVNKSRAQVRQEIEAAVNKVCGATIASAECADDARMDADRQLRELDAKARQANGKIEVARNDPNTVRISLKGKTRAQIEQEIDAAAANVCKTMTLGEQRECTIEAANDAKRRLAETGQLNRLALN